ncbi:glucosamine-6-phosphate deaminase [Algivirga pacifica]|uniref:Glucosamine-6-phosphate deaminase n=2 Tax=Algivirga pacifica TaxID=1162670 RepID=A0ABP9DLZ7_9BACT
MTPQIPDREFEKVTTHTFSDAAEASKHIAERIASLIRERENQGKKTVLGLATGSSPLKVYDELIKLHQEEGLSFRNVITFNLDEYYPMSPDSIHSYVRFMKENLFDHIDILPHNTHIPKGDIPQEELYEYCKQYEEKIQEVGGIDIQLLGIGRSGHIGFNEPGSTAHSKTRLVTLDNVTRSDASSSFNGIENVPRRAITMGVGTILKAKQVCLMAWGYTKAHIVKAMIEGPVTDKVPASFLQQHEDCSAFLDTSGSQQLTRYTTPWLVRSCVWEDNLIKKAVVWLALKIQKPVLMLTEHDYNEHGLDELISTIGSAYDLNIKVFNMLQHTITGWPGGKPNADDSQRPERTLPAQKRVLIFSPHAGNDVISMGGTIERLIEQGHEVHIAYQTSGSLGVSDAVTRRYTRFAKELLHHFKLPSDTLEAPFKEVLEYLGTKEEGDFDSMAIRKIKALVRKEEAIAAMHYYGLPEERIHFLNMPFYETGKVRKKPLGKEDYALVKSLISQLKPHQIFAAGDLSDPHGTQRLCLDAIQKVLQDLAAEDFMKDCWVWLYRGTWQEWNIDEIDMAVPMSPEQVMRKRRGIFFHRSQKDNILYQGEDEREFWKRAEDRNQGTAKRYDELGMAQYAAIEAFKLYKK